MNIGNLQQKFSFSACILVTGHHSPIQYYNGNWAQCEDHTYSEEDTYSAKKGDLLSPWLLNTLSDTFPHYSVKLLQKYEIYFNNKIENIFLKNVITSIDTIFQKKTFDKPCPSPRENIKFKRTRKKYFRQMLSFRFPHWHMLGIYWFRNRLKLSYRALDDTHQMPCHSRKKYQKYFSCVVYLEIFHKSGCFFNKLIYVLSRNI